MKKIFLLLVLALISAQSIANSCTDGSDPVKSLSADGSYYDITVMKVQIFQLLLDLLVMLIMIWTLQKNNAMIFLKVRELSIMFENILICMQTHAARFIKITSTRMSQNQAGSQETDPSHYGFMTSY